MKTLMFSLAIVTFTISACRENEVILGDKLFETNHPYVDGFSRFTYDENSRIHQISLHGYNNSFEYIYLTTAYSDNFSTKIISITYQPHLVDIKQSDTLIYSGNNLIKIIKTIKEKDEVKRRDTSNFVYDQNGKLIEASRLNRKVEFIEFIGTNSTRVKYYNSSHLKFDIWLKYDNDSSPFKELGYLNLVQFNNFNLEGLNYLTQNNIIERTEIDYQPIPISTTYFFNYKYDELRRPIFVTTTRKDDTEFKVKEFYKYR